MNWQPPATNAQTTWPPLAHARSRMRNKYKVLAGAVMLACAICARVAGQAGPAATDQNAATTAIVQRLVENNKVRADRLPECTSKRHYHVEFHGFGRNMAADMDVDVTDHGSASRTFHVTSESGSHVLLDHVLKRLLENEQDAARNREATGLTPLNYRFDLVGNTNENGRPLFILQVEPKVSRGLLYRGKIWVDATDYAVVRIEAQPAENPSFWIRSTKIHHVYSKVGDFWLPQRNVSESKIRFGGAATLTIDYGGYVFASPNAPSTLSVIASSQSSPTLH
ncbi:MAG: hypothetical protein WBA18_00505 [Terracidiphilus sp.]